MAVSDDYASREHRSFVSECHGRTAQPNKPLELTPLRVDQERTDFEDRFRLERFPVLSGRRSSAAGRWAAKHTYFRLSSYSLLSLFGL
jgi:hypothetical protein